MPSRSPGNSSESLHRFLFSNLSDSSSTNSLSASVPVSTLTMRLRTREHTRLTFYGGALQPYAQEWAISAKNWPRRQERGMPCPLLPRLRKRASSTRSEPEATSGWWNACVTSLSENEQFSQVWFQFIQVLRRRCPLSAVLRDAYARQWANKFK